MCQEGFTCTSYAVKNPVHLHTSLVLTLSPLTASPCFTITASFVSQNIIHLVIKRFRLCYLKNLFFVCHCAGCLLINSSSMCTSCFIHFAIFIFLYYFYLFICSAGLAFHVMELSIVYFVLMNAMICRQV